MGGVRQHLLYHGGDYCTEWVNGPSDLSLLGERSCFDPRGSGVLCPSTQAGLGYGVSLPRSRHCLGFRRKEEICRPSAHTTPALLSATSVISRLDGKWGNLQTLCSHYACSAVRDLGNIPTRRQVGKSADPLFRLIGRVVTILVAQTVPLIPVIK